MEDVFRSKDLPRNLTADRLSPTNGPLQVGVALACIGVALLEVGVARATPKVYKSPPLHPSPTPPLSATAKCDRVFKDGRTLAHRAAAQPEL